MSKAERSDGVYLLHIVDSLQYVLDFLDGRGYSDFVGSKLLVNVVVRSFEIVGEAAKNLFEEFRSSNPDIDWKGMTGFRDVLIRLCECMGCLCPFRARNPLKALEP